MNDCFQISVCVSRVTRFPKKKPFHSKSPFHSILAFIIPFTVAHHIGKITFQTTDRVVGSGRATTVIWHPKQLGNLKRAVKDASDNVKIFDPERLSWAAVVRRLGGLANCKLNTDRRLSYRYENTYIVKHLFTFGQRTVSPETIHVIQTTAAPLIYYQLKSSSYAAATVRDGCLIAEEELFYERHVLQPNSTFAVPAGSTYVLLAYQKTIFAMDVISGSLPPKFSKSPTENVEWASGRRFGQQQQLGLLHDAVSSSGTNAAAVDRESSQTTDDAFVRERSKFGRELHVHASSSSSSPAVVVQNPVVSSNHLSGEATDTTEHSVFKSDDLRLVSQEDSDFIDFGQLNTAGDMDVDNPNWYEELQLDDLNIFC